MPRQLQLGREGRQAIEAGKRLQIAQNLKNPCLGHLCPDLCHQHRAARALNAG